MKDGAFPARSTYQVQPSANWPAAFLDLIRTVVVAVRGPHGKKVRELQQGFRYIVAGGHDHALLRSRVGSRGGRQLVRRRVQKSRLIGEQLQSQRGLGARIQICRESVERSLSQPFGKLEAANLACNFRVGLVRGMGSHQRLLQLRNGHAL